jgi:hypothetical protein
MIWKMTVKLDLNNNGQENVWKITVKSDLKYNGQEIFVN